MLKIIVCIFFLNSLAIAEPWPAEVLKEFQELGELVLRSGPQKKTTLKMTPELRSRLFISKGKDRLRLKRCFTESFSCQRSSDGVQMTRQAFTQFKQFFQACRVNGSFQEPKKNSAAEAPALSENPEIDHFYVGQPALSAPSPQQPVHNEPPIVCEGPKTNINGIETSLYVCYPVIVERIGVTTTLPVIDVMWDENLDEKFQELGNKVLDARAEKQSIKVSEALLKLLFKQRDIGEFELRSFSQAQDKVQVSFDGENMKVRSKQLRNLKNFFTNCLNATRFEKPTMPIF